jgi:hemoglobin-like flavoprotein
MDPAPSRSSEGISELPANVVAMMEDELRKQNENELIERRKHTVRASWRAVRFGLDVQATTIFYDRLFAEYPMVRPLFKDNMDVQYRKLFDAVSLVVDCMDDLDKLVPILQALGKAHAGFGTVRAHYEAVTECFLWMLNSYIFEKMPHNNAINWIFEVSDAWEWALTLIGGIMADSGDEVMEENRQKMLAERNEIDEKE